MILTVHLRHLGLELHLYIRRAGDLVDQILRHGGGQRLAAHQHHHPPRIARKVERRLTGRIGAAHDVHIVIAAGDRFGRASSVVNAGAGQAIHAGHVQLTPLDSGGDQERLGGDLAAIGQAHDPVRIFDAQGDGFLRREDLRAEAPRLSHGPARQIGAAQSGWKAQVVFNAGAEAGLTSGRLTLDDHGMQTFGCAIDARREACRASA